MTPITIEPSPSEEDLQRVRDGLSEFNRQHNADDKFTPLTIFLRDEQGNIQGGLLGGTYWGWLYIEDLWLDGSQRKRGYGSRIVLMAEKEALRRGCFHAHLDTTDFQGQGFYEKLGYKVWGVLEGNPPGHQRMFLRKDLK